MKATESNRKLP